MSYDLLVTAVSERADLCVQALRTHLAQADSPPSRIVVHEDVRCDEAGRRRAEPGAIGDWLRNNARGYEVRHLVSSPAVGLGQAMRWCFRQAGAPLVLYTQDDYAAARRLPIQRCLDIMEGHDLNQVRFNQRRTMPAKHANKGENQTPWRKVEVEIDGQLFCVSDHYYTQTALCRVAPMLEAMEAVLTTQTAGNGNQFVSQFNHWMNGRHGDGVRSWDDQAMRRERFRTLIWGPVGEEAFLDSLDVDASRTTGPARTPGRGLGQREALAHPPSAAAARALLLARMPTPELLGLVERGLLPAAGPDPDRAFVNELVLRAYRDPQDLALRAFLGGALRSAPYSEMPGACLSRRRLGLA